jgi:hypothetical protein
MLRVGLGWTSRLLDHLVGKEHHGWITNAGKGQHGTNITRNLQGTGWKGISGLVGWLDQHQ